MPGGPQITLAQILLAVTIAVFAFATPGDFVYKLDVLGFGVCHEIPGHSFFIGGHQLPLCARCTGIYLGALSTVALLSVLRRRSIGLPAWPIVEVLGVFFAAMALDGTNSTLSSFGLGWWDSTNLIRVITGSLAGVAVGFIFYPVFNMSMWSTEVVTQKRVINRPWELLLYMLPAALLVVLVLYGGDWLFYPLSFLSILGMVTLLSMANIILVLIFARREGAARFFPAVFTPMLVGVLFTLLELTLLAWGRTSLAPYLASSNLGFPLAPGLP